MLMKDGDEFDEISNDLKEAVRVSKSVDVAIVCVGELLLLKCQEIFIHLIFLMNKK